MPELPEIITFRNDLKKELLNRKVLNVKTYDNHELKPSADDFYKYVVGYSITNVTNIAKLLLLELSSKKYLAVHLRMSGNLLLNNIDPYVKLSLEFGGNDTLYYSTIRKFGFFDVWEHEKVSNYGKRFGKSVLESNLDANEFKTLMQKKKTIIKSALLDQKVVSGIGNIYANDALYLSRVHPRILTKHISDDQYVNLYNNLKFVLTEGIKHRGSSIDRYKDIYGNPGMHQNHFHVYRKLGMRCTQCNISNILFEKISGRGTFYCPACQIFQPST